MLIKPKKLKGMSIDNDIIARNILDGIISLKNICYTARIKSTGYYIYAFRYARTIYDITLFMDNLEVLKKDIELSPDEYIRRRLLGIYDDNIQTLNWLIERVNVNEQL